MHPKYYHSTRISIPSATEPFVPSKPQSVGYAPPMSSFVRSPAAVISPPKRPRTRSHGRKSFAVLRSPTESITISVHEWFNDYCRRFARPPPRDHAFSVLSWIFHISSWLTVTGLVHVAEKKTITVFKRWNRGCGSNGWNSKERQDNKTKSTVTGEREPQVVWGRRRRRVDPSVGR